MKHFLYRILCGLVLFILIPVVFTLVMQQGQKDSVIAKKDKTAYQTKETDFDEDILTGIIANEVTMETEIEALKAQAVIARTNCYRAIKRGNDPHIRRRKFFRILQPVREQYRSNQRSCHDL